MGAMVVQLSSFRFTVFIYFILFHFSFLFSFYFIIYISISQLAFTSISVLYCIVLLYYIFGIVKKKKKKRAMGRHGFPGIFPAKVWHAAAFSCNGSARGICADAYI